MDDTATDLGNGGFGLMLYNARWYDPSLGRFAQADTVTPGGVQGLDRYSYVNNNPVRYNDPSGHKACDGAGLNGECDQSGVPTTTAQMKVALRSYGVKFTGKWDHDHITAVYLAVYYVGARFTNYLPGKSASEAFKEVYGEVTFEWCNGCVGKGYGWAAGDHLIKFDTMYGDLTTDIRLVAHELGHLFDRAVCAKRKGGECDNPWGEGSARHDLLDECLVIGNCSLGRSLHTGPDKGEYQGFAGDFEVWQFGLIENGTGEPFADMFLGWVFNRWGGGDLGNARSEYMNDNMPSYFTEYFGGP